MSSFQTLSNKIERVLTYYLICNTKGRTTLVFYPKDLVNSILELSNNFKRDIKTKFDFYQEAGVKEYWLIDPTEKTVFVYTLVDCKFIGLPPQTEGENSTSPLFPELTIALEDVFYKKM